MKMYAVKDKESGRYYGPVGRNFGFHGLRVSMFDSPGKARGVITRYNRMTSLVVVEVDLATCPEVST